MPRVFAISDLHVDFRENMESVKALSSCDYIDDVLIIAGDVTDSLERLSELFTCVLHKFYKVCFVPGNHELWVRDGSEIDSIEKFERIQAMCDELGVVTYPIKVEGSRHAVWLVPLLSWYRLPEHDRDNSLFLEKQGENWAKCGWMDSILCRWPEKIEKNVADYFLEKNTPTINRKYDAPIITYSHFLPRRELIFPTPESARRFSDDASVITPHPKDPMPIFNFTRVAGCKLLDKQIRKLGAKLHIYGHQHRNRCRKIEGILYLSHCLGNRREQKSLGYSAEPLLIWENGNSVMEKDWV